MTFGLPVKQIYFSIDKMNNKKRMLPVIALALLSAAAMPAMAQTKPDSLGIADSLNLKSVEVVAQKPVVRMSSDKATYDVQQDADAKTMSLLDMLRKVPMVTVDGQDNISIKGSGNFKVYVDGKPNQMFQANLSMIAKSIPASMVQKVEVITSPGAKYDAEGTMGVLNIIMLRNTANAQNSDCKNCYNGNIAVKGSNRGYELSAYLGGQAGKLTYSVDGFTGKQILRHLKVVNTRRQQTPAGETTQISSLDFTQKRPFSMGNLQLGYNIDTLRSVNVNVGLYSGTENNHNYPVNSFSGGAYGTGFSYQYDNNQRSSYMGVNASADYQRWLNPTHTSSFTLSYLFDYNPNRTRVRTLYNHTGNFMGLTLTDLYSDSRQWATSHTAQADLTFNLRHGQTLETGAKFISRRNKSDSRLYDVVDGNDVLNTDNSVLYRNLQSILAGYAQYRFATEKFNVTAGLRYEHTFESIKYALDAKRNFHKDYGNLVPSATLGYNFSPTSNVALTYTMRIARPQIDELNPYVDRTDPTALSYGNPELQVVKSHNVSLTYNYFKPRLMFNVSLSESYTGNEIESYSFVDADNKYNTTSANNGKSYSTSLSTFARAVITKTTSAVLNASVLYADYKASSLQLHNYGWSANAYLGIEQKLPWKVKGSLGMFGHTRDYNLMGYGSAMQFLNATLTRTFLKERLEVSAMYLCPFGARLKMNNYSAGHGFSNLQHISVPLQAGVLTLKWNFGNTRKQFTKHESKIQNDFNDSHKNDSPTSGMQM